MNGFLLRWMVAAVLLWAALRWLRTSGNKTIPRSGKDGAATMPLVRCAHCGIHLPKQDAIGDGQHYFCSAAHRDRGPAK